MAGALDAPLSELIEGIEWKPGSTERGAFTDPARKERFDEAMKRATKLRGEQSKEFDAAALIRKGREGLAERTERWKEDT